ncbi:hypothetical protein [Bradyrhizobium japonicum]|uniref:hypothetical protein n=1 Tax=Bradyrhizobium japonicum TaxID=375 RepID=UPI0020105ABA|nr:hypothetical protein [Bradyrhizobium japonicum]UQE01146.1 hypothetical protein JEY30_13945 [Bradyrhizobium japonicum]
MDAVQTSILQEPWEIDPRLKELGLTKEGLLEARDAAVSESANATAFHAANAAGTYSYHGGTWALRDRFVGGDWVLDRADGVETIKNDKLKIKVAFSNVDLACNSFHVPKPRTKKGAGAERAIGADLFGGELPRYVTRESSEWRFYYLMVDQDGAAELTRPVVKGGTFIAAIERIYLSRGAGDDGITISDDTTDVAVEFEPQIARK